MRPCRYRPAAVVLLALHVAGCTRWVPTTVSPRVVIEEERPSAVRVTRADGTRMELHDPLITSDSISAPAGLCEEPRDRSSCAGVPSVALDEVQAMDVRRRDLGRTLAGTALLLAVLYFTVAIGASASGVS